MSDQKIVVVFGATGVQGGSVIKSLQNDPVTAKQFKIRGITRDPSKPTAEALKKQGVECVVGNLDSKDSLRKAFQGAYAVFALTSYWEYQDRAREVQQGKNVADTAKETGIQHLIWSSLLDVNKLSKGKYRNVHHFDGKAEIEEYIKSIGVPATFFMPGFYMSNVPTMLMRPNPQSEEHEQVMVLPIPSNCPVPFLEAADDTGKFVKAILKKRDQLLGKRIHAATDYYTFEQVIETFKEVKPQAGKGAHYVEIPPDQFINMLKSAGQSDMGALEFCENLQFMPEFGYFGKVDLGPSLAILDEKPTTLKEFVQKADAWKDLN